MKKFWCDYVKTKYAEKVKLSHMDKQTVSLYT